MGLFSWLFGKRSVPADHLTDEKSAHEWIAKKGGRYSGALVKNKKTGSFDAVYKVGNKLYRSDLDSLSGSKSEDD